MRRSFVRVAVMAGLVVLVLAAAPQVTAVKPPATDLVDVTMTLVGAEGLTTDCDDADEIDGSLLMQRTRSGLSSVESVAPILGLFMAEVAWERSNPGSSGTGFAGCHGGDVEESPGTWDGALWIDIDRQGAVTDLLWHFDYYVDGTTKFLPKKTLYSETLRENFTLSGHDLAWDAANSTVSGTFTVSHFLVDRETGEEILYVPFYAPFPETSRELAFTLTFEPHD